MKKSIVLTFGFFVAASLAASTPARAAFTIGGENGWQLSTDGIVDVFATYASTSPLPGGNRAVSLLSAGGTQNTYDQRFGVGVGLLPSVIAFNVKAPTTNGVDSSVRVGIYPNIQNKSGTRFDTSPNIDFREFFYTAKGAYGELLAGRALNLYQGKNILNDMTLLTAGTIPGSAFRGGTTLGHIGYGYLYTNFGPQIRYTTPDLSGVKVAIEIAEPYKISANTAKTNSPRVEAEISYATALSGGTTLQAWVSGLYQTAPRATGSSTSTTDAVDPVTNVVTRTTTTTPIARAGKDDESIGGAYGVGVGFSGLNLLASGYGGRGLGMLSAQDGDVLGATDTSTDANGKQRLAWGYLLQATYQITPSIKLGANYGQSRQEKNDMEPVGNAIMKNQESGILMATYNLNKFTQFVAEVIYAQNTWMDGAKQHSNQFALGTMFYW
jgi:predicted porin